MRVNLTGEVSKINIWEKWLNKIIYFISTSPVVTCCKLHTVELRWLELVWTVGVSLTHPCVRAILSLTIFKLVHMYFMSSWTPRFFSTKVAKRM